MRTDLTTNWMWQDEGSGGVKGAVANPERKTISWFNEPGCACGDSEFTQAFQEFLQKGPIYINPPTDVLDEIRQNLILLLEKSPA